MRHYEIVLLVHPDQSDQIFDMLKRYQDLVKKNGGNVHRVEDIGRLQLAYTIKDMHKAHYVLFNIECDDKTLSEIESSFAFNDSIMRHLVVRMTKLETKPSKLFLIHNKDKVQNKVKQEDDVIKGSNQPDKIKSTDSNDQESRKELDLKSESDVDELETKTSELKEMEEDNEKD